MGYTLNYTFKCIVTYISHNFMSILVFHTSLYSDILSCLSSNPAKLFFCDPDHNIILFRYILLSLKPSDVAKGGARGHMPRAPL